MLLLSPWNGWQVDTAPQFEGAPTLFDILGILEGISVYDIYGQ